MFTYISTEEKHHALTYRSTQETCVHIHNHTGDTSHTYPHRRYFTCISTQEINGKSSLNLQEMCCPLVTTLRMLSEDNTQEILHTHIHTRRYFTYISTQEILHIHIHTGDTSHTYPHRRYFTYIATQEIFSSDTYPYRR